jgi:hypothetical protein
MAKSLIKTILMSLPKDRKYFWEIMKLQIKFLHYDFFRPLHLYFMIFLIMIAVPVLNWWKILSIVLYLSYMISRRKKHNYRIHEDRRIERTVIYKEYKYGEFCSQLKICKHKEKEENKNEIE